MTDSHTSQTPSPAFFQGNDKIEHAVPLKNTAQSDAGFNTKIINHDDDFLALKPEWNALAAATDPSCVFLRHEWFDAAWRWQKNDCKLNIICVFCQNKLIGIVPLVIRKSIYRRLSIYSVEFLAIPDTQQCDVLAKPEDLPDVTAALAQNLVDPDTRWDTLELRYLSANSPTNELLSQALLKKRISYAFQSNGDNPFIALDGIWQTFYADRGRRLKKSNNLTANRLKNAGAIEIRRYEKAFESDAQRDLIVEAIIGISSRSWKEETGLSLENDGPGQFIRTITNHAAEQGWLSIWLLYLDEKPVAMEYQLAFNGQVHALRADFDNAHRELSVGSYLNWKLLEQLFETDAKNYYMGPGDNAYKLRWTDKSTPLTRIIAYNKTWRGRLINTIECRLRPLIKKILALRPTKKPSQGQE